ncbi:HAMP domain-containing sensor histidine kinase [uncultured Shewanella sp.]|uniref:sensor histidine kinase n=1 Tax=Shewanella atlantica TaxID=271099 RepID=UPI00262025AB|nr:ATP-binding protein [uncultured Shewanella sp.]
MANYLPPLFTRLYVSMIAALCASIFVTLYFSEQFLEQSDIVDFYEDTYHAFTEIRSDLNRSGLAPQQYFDDMRLNHYHFNIQWQKQWQGKADCGECEYLNKIAGSLIYRLNDEQLLAAYPLDGSSGAILIGDQAPVNLFFDGLDGRQPLTLIEIWREDPDELTPFILLFVTILAIGATLYFPVRQLQKQIKGLIDTNRKFGDGELNVRATQKFSEPVNSLADSFNRMAESITETVKENQIFAQAVPHEMRTPLSRIQLATGILRKSNQQADQRELLDNIDSYIDDIDELTKQVLTFSKLNAVLSQEESQSKQLIKLDDYLQSRLQVLNQRQQPNQEHSIDVELDIEEQQLECDPAYLRLMFDNLLKNALRYATSRVLVTVTMKANENDRSDELSQLIISVDDDGPGIDSQHFDSIFLPFSRIDRSRSQQTGGLGLGLAIAKAATRRMHGHLEVSRSELGGARFSCRLTPAPND